MKKKFIVAVLLFTLTVGAISFVFFSDDVKERGKFYTLQEAYDAGLLTVKDLKNIAYYHNGLNDEGEFINIPMYPEKLSDKTKRLIIETEVYLLRTEGVYEEKNAKRKDVEIISYYGTYNGCVTVTVKNIYMQSIDSSRKFKEVVAGVNFWYYGFSRHSLMIWKQK